MKNEAQIRDALIENTIHLIAVGGFEKATTRNIAQYNAEATGLTLNDAYIYRIFGSKEALYEEAFCRLNDELFSAVCRKLDVTEFSDLPVKEDMYYLLEGLWNFLLRSEERCRCYVRYYYSIYLKETSLRRHREGFAVVVGRMKEFFKEEADVNAILHNVLTTMLSFAIRVYNGELTNTQTNAQHIYNVIWCTMSTYLKNNGEG